MSFPGMLNKIYWLPFSMVTSYFLFISQPALAQSQPVCIETSSSAVCNETSTNSLYSSPVDLRIKPDDETVAMTGGSSSVSDDDAKRKPGGNPPGSPAHYVLTALIKIRFWAYDLFSSISHFGVFLALEGDWLSKSPMGFNNFFRPDEPLYPGQVIPSVEVVYMDWSEVPEESSQASVHLSSHSGNEAMALVQIPLTTSFSDWGEQAQQEQGWLEQPMQLINYLSSAWQSLRGLVTAPANLQCNLPASPPASGDIFYLKCDSAPPPPQKPETNLQDQAALVQLSAIKPEASQQVALPKGSVIRYGDNPPGSSSQSQASKPSGGSALISLITSVRSIGSGKKEKPGAGGGGNGEDNNPFTNALPSDYQGMPPEEILKFLKMALRKHYETKLRKVGDSKKLLAKFLYDLYLVLQEHTEPAGISPQSLAQAEFLKVWEESRESTTMRRDKYTLTHELLSDFQKLNERIKHWHDSKVSILSKSVSSFLSSEIAGNVVILYQLIEYFSGFDRHLPATGALNTVLRYLNRKISYEPISSGRSSSVCDRHNLFLQDTHDISEWESEAGVSRHRPRAFRHDRSHLINGAGTGLTHIPYLPPATKKEIEQDDDYIQMNPGLPVGTISSSDFKLTRSYDWSRRSHRRSSRRPSGQTELPPLPGEDSDIPLPKPSRSDINKAKSEYSSPRASSESTVKFYLGSDPISRRYSLKRPSIKPVPGQEFWKPPIKVTLAVKSYHPFTASMNKEQLSNFVALMAGEQGNVEYIVRTALENQDPSENVLEKWMQRYVKQRFQELSDWSKALDDLQTQAASIYPQIGFDKDGIMMWDEFQKEISKETTESP